MCTVVAQTTTQHTTSSYLAVRWAYSVNHCQTENSPTPTNTQFDVTCIFKRSLRNIVAFWQITKQWKHTYQLHLTSIMMVNKHEIITVKDKKLIRRWDSERELYLRRHCTRTKNTIDSCINSATDRRGYVLEHRFTKSSEITQCNGHYVVQGHSRSPILVPIESSYTNSY